MTDYLLLNKVYQYVLYILTIPKNKKKQKKKLIFIKSKSRKIERPKNRKIKKSKNRKITKAEKPNNRGLRKIKNYSKTVRKKLKYLNNNCFIIENKTKF